MAYTLGQAAKATGISKPTLSRAIKSGRLSAQKQEDGSFLIDPAELHRVYPPVTTTGDNNGNVKQSETPRNPETLHVQLAAMREERERERQQLQATIDDLRRRLDAEAEERRKLTLRLLPAPTPPPDAPASPAQASPKSWNARPWFVAALVLACLGVVVALLWAHP
jgi:excisionase family DNA binding protein